MLLQHTLRAEALRSSQISREEEGTYLGRSKGLCSQGNNRNDHDFRNFLGVLFRRKYQIQYVTQIQNVSKLDIYWQHDKCTFCKTEQEALFPILYYCLYSNLYWKNVEQYYLTIAKGFEDALCLRDVIIGITMSSCHSLNYVMLIGNLYLWDCRKNQVLANIEGFKFNVT